MACSNCNSPYIQNKKYNLCGECVFKKSHNGKSKQEIYQERIDKKPKKVYQFNSQKMISSVVSTIGFCTIEKAGLEDMQKALKCTDPIKPNLRYVQDEVSRQNEISQNLAELEARREVEKNGEEFNLIEYEINSNFQGHTNHLDLQFPKKKKKQKSIKQVSTKQSHIEKAYKLTCIDMDHTTEPLCVGCGKYQGGDIKLSHSHIISRADCKRIGKPELIYDRVNLSYHCMDFGMNKGCHWKHENPALRIELLDYQKNALYIRSISEELYQKFISQEKC